jgi:hypothetical protein
VAQALGEDLGQAERLEHGSVLEAGEGLDPVLGHHQHHDAVGTIGSGRVGARTAWWCPAARLHFRMAVRCR